MYIRLNWRRHTTVPKISVAPYSPCNICRSREWLDKKISVAMHRSWLSQEKSRRKMKRKILFNSILSTLQDWILNIGVLIHKYILPLTKKCNAIFRICRMLQIVPTRTLAWAGQQGIKVYRVYIKDDFVLTLIFSMESLNFVETIYCVLTRPRCQMRVSPLVLFFAL